METITTLPAIQAQTVIDFWPHPISADGRHDIITPSGEMLEDVMGSTIGPDSAAVAWIDGKRIDRCDWHSAVLCAGSTIKVRRLAAGGGGGDAGGSNPVGFILTIAILVAAGPLAALIAPGLAGAAAGTLQAGLLAGLTAVIGTAGLLIVNALFPPRLPALSSAGATPERLYSLSGGSNRARPFESLRWLLGRHRMFPDTVAQAYTEYDSEGDQYLNVIFDFGIGSGLTVTPPMIGESSFTQFDNLKTQSGVRRITLVKGNVDTIAGGDLNYVAGTLNIITRTTAANTTRIAFDIVGVNITIGDDGEITGFPMTVRLEWRRTGTRGWTVVRERITSPDAAEGRNAVRRSFGYDVSGGAYDVRATAISPRAADADLSRSTVQLSCPQIRAFQDSETDFQGRNPLAVRIKATGQLYGRLDTVSAIATNSSSNPADVFLKVLRGERIGNRLVAGMGLADRRIDLASIAGWKSFCSTNGLSCNLDVADGRDLNSLLELVAQCGWASADRQTGKWGVIWEDSARPMTAIITPDSIVAGSMTIAYQHDGLADEVTGTFLDAGNDWRPTPIRRTMPGVTAPVRPVSVRLEGITNGDQAAKELNRTVAAQYYHTRIVSWEMDLDEGMGIARGDVVGAAHGILGGVAGGRLVDISSDRRTITTAIDPVSGDVPVVSGPIWVWDIYGKVFARTFTRTARFTLLLDRAMPAVPGSAGRGFADEPTAYRYMIFKTGAALVKLRITSRSARGERVAFTARDEDDAYYNYRTSDLNWLPAGGPAAVLDHITGFTVSETEFGARVFTWNDPDFAVTGYRLRYGVAGAVFSAMLPLNRGLVTSSPFEVFDRPKKGPWRFGIVAQLPNGSLTSPAYATARLLFDAGFSTVTVGDTFPVNPKFGDLHIQAGGVVFKWSGHAWVDTGVDITGPAGATVSAGATFPTGAAVGDAHVDVDGVVYEYDPSHVNADSNGWFDTGVDLTGPKGAEGTPGKIGADGADGAPGATWHDVSGTPAASLGANGDYAIVTSGANIGQVWRKVAGTWRQGPNLKGADGATGTAWLTGSTEPSNSQGANGSYYFRVGSGHTAGEIWRKAGGSWTRLIDIDNGTDGSDGSDGTPGAEWLSGSGAPTGTLGAIGDWYFRTSNGFVYTKTGARTWAYRRDITGPQGVRGARGLNGPPGPRQWSKKFGTLTLIPTQPATAITISSFFTGTQFDTLHFVFRKFDNIYETGDIPVSAIGSSYRTAFQIFTGRSRVQLSKTSSALRMRFSAGFGDTDTRVVSIWGIIA